MSFSCYPFEEEPKGVQIEDEIDFCELCDEPATERVDLEPVRWPGRFIAKLCKKCAEFERKRIKTIKN